MLPCQWCRYQLEDLQHDIKLENVFLNGIWSVAEKCTTTTGVVEKAGEYLKRERRLDYVRTLTLLTALQRTTDTFNSSSFF